ncbi:hypothetical protein [Streptacidiphilus sp. P02-A3a]|uniref:hypothetical protein n=1 Tax=Streptacidiphilus sp. P02-A3a TaxID=2704468 RepID=UPI0015F91C9B|nr:hypothetical protein [Streptacidiphilus sp. P02-A3a]QMU70095.1 hypothetical protein GXP74_19530 [Streptacidiphilus sp. P02-A3a]QMU70452.1 hypothetical protein GXP74_21830 [Streptacidiphilus sp. P02-A3a]
MPQNELILLERVIAAWQASERGRLFDCERVSSAALAEAAHTALGFIRVERVVPDVRSMETASAVDMLGGLLTEMWVLGFRVGWGHGVDQEGTERLI